MKKNILTLVLSLISISQIFAQESGNTDFIRNIGKIYIVVAVIAAVFIGLVIFMITMERRIGKLEQQIKED